LLKNGVVIVEFNVKFIKKRFFCLLF